MAETQAIESNFEASTEKVLGKKQLNFNVFHLLFKL